MLLFNKKRILLSILLLMNFLWLTPSTATEDPEEMLRSVTKNVMSELKKGGGSSNVIQKLILPHIDFNEMARWVIGRNAWNAANNAERQEFIKAFRSLLVRTYTRSLQDYADQSIEFRPARNKGADRVQISSMISANDGKETRMDYLLIKTATGWKVYDVLIEGISIVQGYRSQFAEAVESNGIQGAIAIMRNKNDD